MFTEGAGRAADQGAARVPPSTRFQQPFGWRSALVVFVVCVVAVVAAVVFVGDDERTADPGDARFLQGEGPKDSEPFQLQKGLHRLDYRVTGPNCEYTATLHPEATPLFTTAIPDLLSMLALSGTRVDVEKSGEHFVRMATGPSCQWEIEIRRD